MFYLSVDKGALLQQDESLSIVLLRNLKRTDRRIDPAKLTKAPSQPCATSHDRCPGSACD
jgi:hypothetical protein